MRVLAITNMFPSAAFPTQGVFVKEQIRAMEAIGLTVRVLFMDRRQLGPAVYYRMEGDVRRAVSGFRPDVIHVMYGGVMADRIVRQRHGCPAIVTFHGSDLLGENLSGWKRKIISRFGVHCSRRAARRADGVVVVARHLVRALNGAAAAEKIRVIPCGIDPERFRPMDTLICKQRLGWDPQAFHILFASGNGDPVKRPWLAEAAAARLNQPSELHCMTAVPYAEVPVWLNASDVLLLTSLHEGSPTVVKEALACGLPVVSVDVGDVAERIRGIEGCHLAPADADGLAKRLCLVRQCGKRLDCRAQVSELSSLHSARKLKKFYEQITNKVGASDSPESSTYCRPVREEAALTGELPHPEAVESRGS